MTNVHLLIALYEGIEFNRHGWETPEGHEIKVWENEDYEMLKHTDSNVLHQILTDLWFKKYPNDNFTIVLNSKNNNLWTFNGFGLIEDSHNLSTLYLTVLSKLLIKDEELVKNFEDVKTNYPWVVKGLEHKE